MMTVFSSYTINVRKPDSRAACWEVSEPDIESFLRILRMNGVISFDVEKKPVPNYTITAQTQSITAK